MRVCQLASGSKGNSLYIESEEGRLLIDAGLSAKELAKRLEGIGASPSELNALLVTHEHGDHCRGLGPMARRYDLPVYIHHETVKALPRLGKVADLYSFEQGASFSIGDIKVETFPLTHDAHPTVGFTIESREGKVGVVTDLGIATRLVQERLRDCRVLVLESNHDEELLRDGPYPWHLKQRISSNHGHLSNRASAELLEGLLWEGLEAVFLVHLSEENNCPNLVEESARRVLQGQSLCSPQLIIGTQHQVSECFVG